MKALLEYRKSAPLIDAAALTLLGIALWSLAVHFKLTELFYHFTREHEIWQLDEIVLAAQTFGLMAFIYSMRWLIAARHELDRRRKAESDAAWLGHHDALTRLPNRSRLADLFSRAEDMVHTGKVNRYVVYSIDLLDFRKVNDLFGQSGGDRFLVETAERLNQVAPDELVMRLGADEFLVVADCRHIGNPRKFAERIVNAIKAPVHIQGQRIGVTANLGFALFPENAPTLEETTRRAEFALSRARKSQLSIFAFDAAMEEELHEHTAIQRDLADAIHGDEIEPYYQPIVDLKTGRLTGLEMLARWNRNGEGFVPPSLFIVMAEEAGLIIELSEKLLSRACRQARDWPADVKLSVNISAVQLADRLLGLRILKLLADAGLPPERLVVEVTESALIRDLDTAEAVLNDLHYAGTQLALDDFGTGYSSLFQLSRFPFDVIKIDRSFVSAFETDKKQSKIIRAIVALSHELGISNTAEGIERVSQSVRLSDMGCSHGQGYLFGRPIPAEQLPDYFLAREAELPTPADDEHLGKRRSA